MQEKLGIAGSGAIACGLAATAARAGEVMLWARSDESADRAQRRGTRLTMPSHPHFPMHGNPPPEQCPRATLGNPAAVR